jgi:PAS domain S-box-containing protein
VEWSEDAIVGLTPEGIVQSWNRGAEQLTGVPAAEAIGRSISEFAPERHRAAQTAALEQARAGEPAGPLESERVHRNGTRYDVSVVYSPLRDPNGRVVGISSVVRDIGERKRAEAAMQQVNATLEQRVHERTAELEEANRKLAEANRQLERANRELEAFSYSVSHDLRSPLRALDGFSRILLEDYSDRLDDEGRRFLNLVRDNAQRMGALINDLLAFSRLSRQPLEKRRVDAHAIAQQAWDELRGEAEGRDVRVTIGPLPECEADPSLLRQVFLNLLSNALKYTRRREHAVIEVGATGAPGSPVYFVRDNGVGFDMKYAGKLFGVFQRLHRADEYEGTGVGLALAQRIVTRHGGRIWAEAAPDRGATFSFTIGLCAD